MKITPANAEYVEHDGTTWLRFPDGNWLINVGESWEQCYLCSEIEAVSLSLWLFA